MSRVGLFIIIAFFLACDSGNVLPEGTGRNGEVMLVISQQLWEGKAGGAIREVLQSEQEGLPQSEPLFSVIKIPPYGFDGTFQRVRNVVIVEQDTVKPGAIVKENVWASDQVVIRLQGNDQEQLRQVILSNRNRIRETLYQNDFRKIRQWLEKTRDVPREQEVFDLTGLTIWVPEEFKLVQKTDSFSWFKHSLQKRENGQVYDITKSVWIYKEPYSGPEQLNKVALAERRNRLTAEFIEGPADSSYMRLMPGFPHAYNTYELNGKEIYELKGLWNMKNARMAGPFVTFSFTSPDQKTLYTLDAFLFAPNTEKRDYMRELEAIISTAEFSPPQAKK